MSSARHHLTDAVRVECSAVHAAVDLGDEDQLHTELLGIAHRADDVLRTLIVTVEVELALRREVMIHEVAERHEHHLQSLGVETRSPHMADRLGHCTVPSRSRLSLTSIDRTEL